MKRVVDVQACEPESNYLCEPETFFVETLIFRPNLPNVDIKPSHSLDYMRSTNIRSHSCALYWTCEKLYILGTMNR